MPIKKRYFYKVYADKKFVGNYPSFVQVGKSIGVSSYTTTLIFKGVNTVYSDKYKITKEYYPD